MNILTRKNIHKASEIFLYVTVFFLMFLCGPVWGETEGPLKLPKVEGSKSFDLEISQINRLAIKKYHEGLIEIAVVHIKRP